MRGCVNTVTDKKLREESDTFIFLGRIGLLQSQRQVTVRGRSNTISNLDIVVRTGSATHGSARGRFRVGRAA